MLCITVPILSSKQYSPIYPTRVRLISLSLHSCGYDDVPW
ncbi:MAG: hypothetical protein OJF51_002161 [Nitrospira sp.]|nr:MAG: hypothetical protein OJF51_002161 [Nitrospira sp.]